MDKFYAFVMVALAVLSAWFSAKFCDGDITASILMIIFAVAFWMQDKEEKHGKQVHRIQRTHKRKGM